MKMLKGLRMLMMVSAMLLGLAQASSTQISHARKAEMLYDQCRKELQKFEYGKVEKLATAMLDESREAHDKRLMGYSHLYRGIGVMMSSNSAKAARDLKIALKIGEITSNDTLCMRALNALGIFEANVNSNLHLAQRRFLKSRDLASTLDIPSMYCSTSSNLAEISRQLEDTAGYRYAYDSFIKAKDIGDAHNIYVSAAHLAHFLNMKLDTANARKYIDLATAVADSCGFDNSLQLLLEKATIAEIGGRYDEAMKNLLDALPLYDSSHTYYLPYIYYRLAFLSYRSKHYSEAIKYVRRGIAASHEQSSYSSLSKLYLLGADIFNASSQPDSASYYMQLAIKQMQKNEYIQRSHLEDERHIIEKMAEQEKVASVSEVRMSMQWKLILALSFVLLLTVLCLVIVIRNHRHRMKLVNAVVRSNRETIEMADRLRATSDEDRNIAVVSFDNDMVSTPAEEDILVNCANRDAKPKGGLSEQKGAALYQEACRLMKEERLYADPRFNREEFIERLGTNHTYLAQVMQRYGGSNFSLFVNSYRIEDAIRILSDPEQADVTMREVCKRIGFGSMTSFYKFFQAATGVPPSSFRKSALADTAE